MSILGKKLLSSSANDPTYVTIANAGAGLEEFYYSDSSNLVSYSCSLDYTDANTGLDVRPFTDRKP